MFVGNTVKLSKHLLFTVITHPYIKHSPLFTFQTTEDMIERLPVILFSIIICSWKVIYILMQLTSYNDIQIVFQTF